MESSFEMTNKNIQWMRLLANHLRKYGHNSKGAFQRQRML